ncbi:divergent polysaccharide deacetylase family protein [Nitratireductor rhodophyticola]|uniref:divergent polysaccharide deacetylase family protein n=1 Tax=Nitratireductor rhodophyticola TaxID=2854036 RepID=UPI002AC9CF16|nr:divergent polysaccharide deacetylase family protein [Nitratireductor rhodophyticola]WPZ15643.1 divergent polysaccharide deacetylase family protein [Nitratireductor rhodophyticola]
MISGNRDIDRPLGRDSRPEKPKRRGIFTTERILVSLAVIAILGVSTAVALRDRPFRTPSAIAVTEPVEQTIAEATAPEPTAEAREQGAPNASITRLGPEEPASNGVIVIRDPSAMGQHPRLAHLPDRALIEESETGPLPVRDAGGRRPFDVYARSWSGTRGARIAVIVGGLGLSQTTTQEAIETLRPEITLAFAPAGNSLGRWMQAARKAGHEVVLQVPMEPFGYPSPNPGRNTLTVDASSAENLSRLRWALSRITNYTGVMNYMGGRFTADSEPMGDIMAELGKRGLMYIDDGTSARSVAQDLALQEGVPFAASDVLIDPTGNSRRPERGEILKKLDELERIARARGFAIGTGSAFDETIDTVAEWAGEVTARGIELVPISALAADPQPR